MLYIVATPIGNLEDITQRALKVLSSADSILVEDTKKAGLLLKYFNIPKKTLVSYYEHNEERRIPEVIKYLKRDKNVALLSRAGTPLISDPGFKLIRKCIEEKIPFTSVPAASSVINALILSGLPVESFLFLGFLPRKKGKRRKKIEEIKNFPYTIILFESPYRVVKALIELKEILGERKCCVCREMTKLHEQIIRGNLSEVIKRLSGKTIKGECTVVLEGFK